MKLGLYRHYKGQLYQVLGIARHSETLEEVVVYQALYHNYGLWARPRVMFEGSVEKEGASVPRFTFIQECLSMAPVVEGV